MINYSNTSKLLFSQVQDTNSINLKPKTSQGTSNLEFKSVLDKSMNNTAKRSNVSNVSKNNNDVSQNPDSKVKYKSFKDVQMEKNACSKQSLVEKPAGDTKLQNIDSETEKNANTNDQYDESINVLAQMLGLQPSQLVKLANELGFSSEDLKDINKLSLFTDKLSNLLGLSDSQKAMMNTLALEVPKLVKENHSSEVVATLESIKVDTNEVNASNNTKNIELSKIVDEVKLKLDQLIQNATVSAESVNLEISKVIEAMRSQMKAKVTLNAEQVDNVITSGDPAETGIASAEQLSVREEDTNANVSAKTSDFKEKVDSKSNTSDTKAQIDTKSVVNQVSTSNDQNQQLNQQNVLINGDVKVGMIGNQVEVHKSTFSIPQPIKSSEVLNQVVEHAKVIIGQDKSEMVIHLKPDHLGKLELKVVTEQGIVAAKFIAESQQVKEIIETNMQSLKEALQKQGISVESVNVQVGQDKQNENQQQNSFQSNSSNSSNRLRSGSNELGISKIGMNAFDTLPERLARYAYDTNTINLTA